MSKPLELTVYLRDEEGDYQHPVTQLWWSWLEVEDNAELKRFTDAELAAEMHAANSDAWRAHSAKGATLPLLEGRFQILARFAKLPHYDEEPGRD